MTAEGQGVGRTDEGLAVFVREALPGDLVTAELTKVKKRYAFGRLLSLDEASPDRTEGFCDYSQSCGGCPFGLLTYEKQLAVKEKQVRETLSRLGGLESPQVRPILAMADPFRYRNKASMPVSTGGIITRKGGVVEGLTAPSIGFYRPRSHDVVDCMDCGLQSVAAMAAADALRRFMAEDNITGYDPRWDKGLLRHLVVRTAFGTGEVMVILVINGKGIPNAAKLVEMLDDAISSIDDELGGPFSLESVVINMNKGNTAEIFGDKTEVLAGKPTIEEHIGDMRFEISPLSFYQVNPQQMAILYDKAVEYAALSGGETILDLYCGAGTIGLWLLNELRSRDALGDTSVIGIESVKSAVIDANRNAVINNIVNARYVLGRAEEKLPELMDADRPEPEEDQVALPFVDHADVAVLDPPRSGCDQRLLEAVMKAGPERIVYVSCDPSTLARDLKILGEGGYEFMEATPVDMFPWTGHVETCVLLSHKNSHTSAPSL